MKRAGLFVLLALLPGLCFAQSPSPAISQVFVYFCTASFQSCPYGLDPILAPVQTADGNLFAPAFWGGQGNPNAGGTVVRTTTSGFGFAVHTFQPTGGTFPNGENPSVSLVKGPDGNLYGVTLQGGTHNFGVFYKLTESGGFQVLYNFCSQTGCPDAGAPITLASDGNFYGVADTTFFRLTPQGAWSAISTISESVGLATRLIQARDGNFYGAANIIFRLTPTGQLAVLHRFQYPLFPTSPLIQGSDGYFYGATGGSGPGTGIFRISLSGYFAFIHQMTDAEGYGPVQLLQASDGNIWGISDFRNGSFFSISPSGVSQLSGAFSCATTGCAPTGFIEASDGNFYGVAESGGHAPGQNPLGTIFKIAAGLPH